ncbi:hypothetical protein C0992_009905, partial [Termitomyces sp. T32_za158]
MENRALSPTKMNRSYAEALRTPSASPLSSPPGSPLSESRSPAGTPMEMSPDIALSPLPPISTQEQLLIENSVVMDTLADIRPQNPENTGYHSTDKALEAPDDNLGWQIVTPKKNRKKEKKPTKKAPDSNKRPHSDSPIKERKHKRHATSSASEHSEGTLNTKDHTSPCPSPTLSVSALGYSDTEQQPNAQGEKEVHDQTGANDSSDETPRAGPTQEPDSRAQQEQRDTPHQ